MYAAAAEYDHIDVALALINANANMNSINKVSHDDYRIFTLHYRILLSWIIP
jgi:hypothetical protein